jgi:hypothetical protein
MLVIVRWGRLNLCITHYTKGWWNHVLAFFLCTRSLSFFLVAFVRLLKWWNCCVEWHCNNTRELENGWGDCGMEWSQHIRSIFQGDGRYMYNARFFLPHVDAMMLAGEQWVVNDDHMSKLKWTTKFFYNTFHATSLNIFMPHRLSFLWCGKIFFVNVQNILPCGQGSGMKTHNFFAVVFICSNSHIEMFMARKYIVDSSIPWSLNIYMGKIVVGMCNLLAFQLLACCFNLNIESLFTFLPQWDIVSQLLAFASLGTYFHFSFKLQIIFIVYSEFCRCQLCLCFNLQSSS